MPRKRKEEPAHDQGNPGDELSEMKVLHKEILKRVEKLEYDLRERRKELACQNRMSVIFSSHSRNLFEICEQVVEIIPPAWQFPELTGAMISIFPKQFKTDNFSEEAPMMMEEIVADQVKVGFVKVCFLGKIHAKKMDIFLPEEYDLIKSIALRLGNVVAMIEWQKAKEKGEILYQSILSASPDVITITDLEGKILFSSARAMQMFGGVDADFIGHPLMEFVDPSFHEKARVEIMKMMSGEISQAAEYLGVRLDGSRFDMEVNGEFLRDATGKPIQMIFVTRDITDRKNAERLLVYAQERYKNMIENLNDVVYEVSIEGIVNYVSPSIERFLGFKPEELTGKSFFQYMYEEDRLLIMKRLSDLAERDYDFLEYRYYTKEGEIRWVRSSTNPMFSDGKLVGGRGVLIDVTERKKAELAVHASENLYRTLVNSADAAILLLDREGRYKYINSIGAERLQLPAEEIIGKTVYDIFPEQVADRILENVKFVMDENKGRVVEEELVISGETRYYRTSTQPLKNDQGIPIAALIFATDITTRRKVEILIQESEKKYKNLFEMSPDGYLIFQDGIFIECNKASERLVGGTRADIVGKRPDEISPEFQPNGKRSFDYVFEVVREAFETGKNEFEWTHKRADGTEFLALIHLAPINYGNKDALLVSWKDITQFREAEKSIRKSEEKYRIIFETIRDVYYEADLEGKIIEVSPSVSILSKGQLHREDLIGKSLFDFYLDSDDRARFLKKLSEKGIVDDYEVFLKNIDGSVLPISLSSSYLYDKEGKPLKIAGSVRDITERRKADEEMRKFRTITDKANYGVCITLPDGNIIYVNPYWARMHGYEPIELMGKNLAMFHSGKQLDEVANSLRLLYEKGEFEAIEVGHTRKDGTEFPTLMSAVVVSDHGKPVYMSATAIDITEIKEKEREIKNLNVYLEDRIAERTAQLAKSHEELTLKTLELEQFFNVALDLLCIADTSGNFLKVNKAWEPILGYSASDLEKRQFLEFVHPDDLQPTLEAMSKLDAQNPILNFTNRYRSKDGTYRFIEWHSVPVGQTIYAAARDVTERIEHEEELRKARLEAEGANQAKSEFLSRMSHELRTPMNSILGFAQLLERGALNPGQNKAVSHILRSGKHLLELINEVLDISRIEAGRISMSPEPVQISGVIQEMLDIVQPQAAEREIKLEVIQSSNMSLYVRADRQRLKQVVLNLINNAIKYNRQGGSVMIMAENMLVNEQGWKPVRISVKDTGQGIRKEDIPKLFVPFERIGAENTETEGTGLGLAVVKKLVELMGGQIGVESEPGAGALFWIELPEAESQLNAANLAGFTTEKGALDEPWTGLILYIEDNKPNIDLVQDILDTTRPGIRLITTLFGKKAVGMAREYAPDLILLDLNLPDIHGSDVLRMLKTEPETQSIPVVVITADAVHAHIKPTLQAGALDYLIKPLDIDNFLSVLDKIFHKK